MYYYYKNFAIYSITVLVVSQDGQKVTSQVFGAGQTIAYTWPALDRYCPYRLKKVDANGHLMAFAPAEGANSDSDTTQETTLADTVHAILEPAMVAVEVAVDAVEVAAEVVADAVVEVVKEVAKEVVEEITEPAKTAKPVKGAAKKVAK